MLHASRDVMNHDVLDYLILALHCGFFGCEVGPRNNFDLEVWDNAICYQPQTKMIISGMILVSRSSLDPFYSTLVSQENSGFCAI
jgi:hypothetical protein